MTAPELTFIPKRTRLLLLMVLGLGAIASSGLCLYFAVVSPRLEIAVVSLGAAQAAVSGFVIVALVSSSLRMKTSEDLQLLQDNLFEQDILPTLLLCGAPREEQTEFVQRGWFSASPRVKPASKLLTNFHRGIESVSVLLEDPSGQELDMYIKINVKNVMVRYFFDPHDFDEANNEAAFFSAFEQTLNGAKSVGFDIKLLRRFHASKNRIVLELSLYLDVGEGLLVDPEKRLFLRNDIRLQTESMLHSLKAHKIRRTAVHVSN